MIIYLHMKKDSKLTQEDIDFIVWIIANLASESIENEGAKDSIVDYIMLDFNQERVLGLLDDNGSKQIIINLILEFIYIQDAGMNMDVFQDLLKKIIEYGS